MIYITTFRSVPPVVVVVLFLLVVVVVVVTSFSSSSIKRRLKYVWDFATTHCTVYGAEVTQLFSVSFFAVYIALPWLITRPHKLGRDTLMMAVVVPKKDGAARGTGGLGLGYL